MSTKFMGGWKPQPNLPSNQFDKGGLTYNPGQQSPWMENMKADQALSEVMQNPFADQKAIKLGQDVALRPTRRSPAGRRSPTFSPTRKTRSRALPPITTARV